MGGGRWGRCRGRRELGFGFHGSVGPPTRGNVVHARGCCGGGKPQEQDSARRPACVRRGVTVAWPGPSLCTLLCPHRSWAEQWGRGTACWGRRVWVSRWGSTCVPGRKSLPSTPGLGQISGGGGACVSLAVHLGHDGPSHKKRCFCSMKDHPSACVRSRRAQWGSSIEASGGSPSLPGRAASLRATSIKVQSENLARNANALGQIRGQEPYS